MSKYVFVVVEDFGSENFGKPLRAFSDESLAALMVDGASVYGSRLKVVALDLETPDDFRDADSHSKGGE
ncbi:MAG: hypothetical protein RLW68_00890 [Devosia marina]|uniref:hypothetical protein n=1 Tax=Devosia marina TaxID=2683198 RepID=UPI0032EEEF88